MNKAVFPPFSDTNLSPPTAGLKQRSSFTFSENLYFLNKILASWEIELDLCLNLNPITSFIYSSNKYFEDPLCAKFVLVALFFRNYLVVL